MADPNWNLSCLDWADCIRSGRSLVPNNLPLNRVEADRAVEIFNCLRLPDVRGTPTLREAGGDWFREIVAALFGSIDALTGQRFIRGLFILAPKKSSKTSYGAALMLTALLMNTRPRAEMLLIGPTKITADLAFNQAVGMIQANEELNSLMHVQEHLRQITHVKTKAQLKIKAFDSGVLTGVKPIAILVDELHEVARSPDAARIIGQLRGGLLPNPEGFLAFISTQSDQTPRGAFRTELYNARGIRDGRIKGDALPILYEFPPDIIADGTWRDPANWHMVTPNAGRSVTVARLIEDFDRAQDAGEEEVRRWASQHLNIEIGLALRSDRWVGADYWEERGDATLMLDTLIGKSDVVVMGLDFGGMDDWTGAAVAGRDSKTREWMLWCHAWAHPIALERRKSEASRAHDFEACGDLTIVATPGDDVRELADLVERVSASGKLPDTNAIGVDAAGGIGALIDELVARGIRTEQIIGISQGWKLNGAIKTTERKLGDGTLKHAAQPMMAWQVSNAKCEPRGNAILITKAASGTSKIDALMAAFNAISLLATNPVAGGSVYSADRGLLILGV